MEMRNVAGDLTGLLSVCMAMNVTRELQLVSNSRAIEYPGWFAISVGLQVNTSLKCLRLWTELDVMGASALAEGLKLAHSFFRILDLSHSTLDDTEAVEALALGLQGNTSLQELHFMGCSLTDEYMSRIATALKENSFIFLVKKNSNSCREFLGQLLLS